MFRKLTLSSSLVLVLFSASASAEPQVLAKWSQGLGKLTAAALSPDGNWVAAANEEKKVLVLDVATGAQHAVITGHGEAVQGLAFFPDGKLLASVGPKSSLRVWTLDGEEKKKLNKRVGSQVAVSPDGQHIAIADSST